jgi:hypothetical protein
MSRHRFVPSFAGDATETPFSGAEEAWFWFVRCQMLRRSGARLGSGERRFQRPCDPDDIYSVASQLFRQGVLRARHLRVLSDFGIIGRPPDRRCAEEETAVALWREALDRMSVILRAKGVIE